MSTTITTASGRTRTLPATLAPERVLGLDEDGRFVVAVTDDAPFLFGLTLCCDASDKGAEHGIVCRGCYGSEEVGNYLWRNPDGTYDGLDPVVES